eukprot:1178026-Prorocentrum_minimum.AAC.4
MLWYETTSPYHTRRFYLGRGLPHLRPAPHTQHNHDPAHPDIPHPVCKTHLSGSSSRHTARPRRWCGRHPDIPQGLGGGV